MLDFRILGPLEVVDGDRILPLGGEKQRATLAILLLHRNEVVSRDALIEGIWGDAPPNSASSTLDTYVSRLRKVLRPDGTQPRLHTQPPGYRLRVEDDELDLQRFEALVDAAVSASASGDARAEGEFLRVALSEFRGAPLDDLAHTPFAQAEAGRLNEMRLGALELRLDRDLERGGHADIVGELESLVARFPFRERFWAQLMLALYRSDRQGDALLTFDRARSTLGEELGVDPGPPLQDLHQRVLRQDPDLALARASVGSRTSTPRRSRAGSGRSDTPSSDTDVLPPSERQVPGAAGGSPGRAPPRRRSMIVAIGALVFVLVVVAIAISAEPGRREQIPATFRPGTVLLDVQTGRQAGFIPPTELAVAAYPIYADGRFWVNDWDPNAFVEIDPRTGQILKHVDPPARDPSVLGDFATLTPFAVDGNTLWAVAAHDLVKMDIRLDQEAGRFPLDDLVGGSGIAEGVAVGAGSVWVSRDVGRGQIVRLDPATGRVQQQWDNIMPYLNLAFGDGSLWAADDRGIARIDPDTGLVFKSNDIQGNQMVVAGGGFGWTSDDTRGVVHKVDSGGRLVATYDTGLGATFMAYMDGVVWVGNQDDGTVTGVDAVTGEPTVHRFGHPVATIAAGDGVLLAYLGPGPSVQDRIDALHGDVATFFAHEGQLGQGDEPALNTHPGAYQIAFATCAKLVNHPDQPSPEGWDLQPEIAAAMPTVSTDGRTYTFEVRHGYRFSPPYNEPVTAETFRFSIERALSPGLAEDPPGPHHIDDIEGQRAFRRGDAEHISGLRVDGDTLSITLVEPSGDFLHRLALPFFCPVPLDTPFGPHGLTNGAFGGAHIPSAGPYYVADYLNEEYVILRRNPNYAGPRPQTFDAIAIREGVDAGTAADRVLEGSWDGITTLFGPELEPGGALDERWGAESSAATLGQQRYFLSPIARTRFIAFNAGHGMFSDRRVRRAAARALDRTALAAIQKELVTDQLLPSVLPGYGDRDLYPMEGLADGTGDVISAGGRGAVMAVQAGCGPCLDEARIVQVNLAAIGIEVEIQELQDLDSELRSGETFDLMGGTTEILYPDPASFLMQLVDDVPSGWLPPGVREKIQRLEGLSGERRWSAAGSLADRLAVREVPVAAYGTSQISTFIGPRLGCRVFPPFGYGIDLAALCFADAD